MNLFLAAKYGICKSKEIKTDLCTLKNWRKYLGSSDECHGFFVINLSHQQKYQVKHNDVIVSSQSPKRISVFLY